MAAGPCLGIDDFSNVYMACDSVKVKWRILATYLKVHRPIVEEIGSIGNDVALCLDKILSAWLRCSSPTQPKPSWETLCDALAGMGEVALSERIQREHPREHPREHSCGCGLCFRNTAVAKAVRCSDVNKAATELKTLFEELLEFLHKEIRHLDMDTIRFRINKHFKNEEDKVDDTVEPYLSKIEHYDTPNAILNYFYRYNFIGYINYSLVKVFQALAKSLLLDKCIEEYEKDYQCFLKLSLMQVHNAFQQCPDLHPDYPAGIPKFTIHLESDWDGKSAFNLKEFLKQCFNNSNCIDQLMIAKISRNCIIVTFAVLPHITQTVLQYLTDDDVISTLKKEGITVNVSTQLMKYQQKTTEEKGTMSTDSITATEKVEAKQDLQDRQSLRLSGLLLIDPNTASSSSRSSASIADSGYGRLVKDQQKPTEDKGTMTANLEIPLSRGLVDTEKAAEVQEGATAADVYELYRASKNGDSDLVNLLLSRGTKVDFKNNAGQTPLYIASRNGHSDVVKILLFYNATVDIKDNRGWTPLHIASAYGHSDVVDILLSHRAKIDIKDNQGRTPLHEAADYNRDSVVGILLSCGATANIVDTNRQTPLHHCLLNSSYDNIDATVGLLISHGANLYQKDKYNQSPILIATVLGREQLLLAHGVSEDTIAMYRLPPGWKVDYSDQIVYTNAVTGNQLSTHPLLLNVATPANIATPTNEFCSTIVTDTSVQFDYCVPMEDLLYGATVVDSRVFNVHGDHEQTYPWPECGFSLYIPAGSLDRIETCPVAVKALISGRFEFPKGFQLISALYAISPGRKFKKKIKMSIQHCFQIQRKEQLKRLRFIKACGTANPSDPYVVEYIDGGTFTPGSLYCDLWQNEFSIYAAGIAGDRNGTNPGGDDPNQPESNEEGEINDDDHHQVGDKGPGPDDIDDDSSQGHGELDTSDSDEEPISVGDDNTAVAEDLPNNGNMNDRYPVNKVGGVSDPDTISTDGKYFSMSYQAYFFFQKTGRNSWNFKLVAIENLAIHSKYVKDNFVDEECVEGFMFQFLYCPDPSIKFTFSEERIQRLPSRWQVISISDPCSIPKKEIDAFSQKSRDLRHHYSTNEDITQLMIPMRKVFVSADATCNHSYLDYGVAIEGIKQAKTIHIVRQLTSTQGSMTESQSSVKNSVPAHQEQYEGITDLRKLKSILNKELDHEFADLESLLEANIAPFASQLFQNGMITQGVKSNPSFNAIIREVKAIPCRSAEVIVKHYKKFLEIVAMFGEPLKDLASFIADNMSKAVLEKFENANINFA